MTIYIKFNRFEYEEPYITHIVIEFYTSGNLCTGEIYVNATMINEFANIFIGFPQTISDYRKFEIGSEILAERWAHHLLVETRTINKTGLCGIHIRWSNNRTFPYGVLIDFTIQSDPQGLNELGMALKSFAKMNHEELLWDGCQAVLQNRSE